MLDRALIILIILLVVACSGEPKLKADNEADFSSSFAEATKEMSAQQKEKLDAALRDIVLVETGLYGPMLEARSSQAPTDDAGAALGRGFAQLLTGAASKLVQPPPQDGINTARSWSWSMHGQSSMGERRRKLSALPRMNDRGRCRRPSQFTEIS
jgi:hypothetical protein